MRVSSMVIAAAYALIIAHPGPAFRERKFNSSNEANDEANDETKL